MADTHINKHDEARGRTLPPADIVVPPEVQTFLNRVGEGYYLKRDGRLMVRGIRAGDEEYENQKIAGKERVEGLKALPMETVGECMAAQREWMMEGAQRVKDGAGSKGVTRFLATVKHMVDLLEKRKMSLEKAGEKDAGARVKEIEGMLQGMVVEVEGLKRENERLKKKCDEG